MQIVLNEKNCELIRPPSVSSSEKMTADEVIETKRIASLRIHIERVIRRLREYNILEPHSCLDLNVMLYINDIITIVAGLIICKHLLLKNNCGFQKCDIVSINMNKYYVYMKTLFF